jgi:large subunit ribosomal protein L9
MSKQIEVLLRDHVHALGECGDVVRVRSGYARNYLVPHGLATEATPENKKLMERRRVKLQAVAAVKNAEMDAWIAKLTGVVVTTAERADAQGHLFGSVNAAAIVALLAAAGHVVDEKHVRLDAPLKTVGEHTVKIHVHGERFAEVKVNVTASA